MKNLPPLFLTVGDTSYRDIVLEDPRGQEVDLSNLVKRLTTTIQDCIKRDHTNSFTEQVVPLAMKAAAEMVLTNINNPEEIYSIMATAHGIELSLALGVGILLGFAIDEGSWFIKPKVVEYSEEVRAELKKQQETATLLRDIGETSHKIPELLSKLVSAGLISKEAIEANKSSLGFSEEEIQDILDPSRKAN